MRKLLTTLAATASIAVGGCSTFGDGLDTLDAATEFIPDALDKTTLIYRPTIQQGNVVTQEQVNKLEPGMTRRQVRFVLGSPTLRDLFHEDRWDYPFTVGIGSVPSEKSYLTVYFEDDRLVRITGDLRPQPEDERAPEQKPAVASVPDWVPEDPSLLGRAASLVGIDTTSDE